MGGWDDLLVLYIGFLRSRLSVVMLNKVVGLFRLGLTLCFPITCFETCLIVLYAYVGICLALV